MKRRPFFKEPLTIFIMAMAIFCLVAAAPMVVMAQQDASDPDSGAVADGEVEDQDDPDAETPAFSDTAQVAKARNIAEAEAVKEDPAVRDALDALEAAKASGASPEEVEALQQDLDDAIADAIANVSDTDVAEIKSLHDAGTGWGRIALDKGIHPSVLGLGNKFGHTQTHRNRTKAAHGYGKETGSTSSTMRSLTGNAYGLSKDNKGKGTNNAGGIGKAIGKDNKEGKSNSGKGGGKGGGNAGGKNK